MFNFLQTQQAQIYAGIIIALSTIIAFFITYVRNKKGNNAAFVFPSSKECSLLTAENWFAIISKSIEYSTNVTELKSQIDNIETFRKKKFRFHITKAERRELIEDLYTLYVEKEIELQTSISVELCVN